MHSFPSETSFLPDYGPPQPEAEALVLPFVGTHLLIAPDRSLPGAEALLALGESQESLVIGRLGGKPCELRLWPAATAFPGGLQKGDYRHLWGHWPQGLLAALARGRQLAAWLLDSRFCGVCGQPLATQLQEPARRCGQCGTLVYPRISPVCIGLVLKGEELLLARSPHFPPGIYSALAGYVEAGESLEECLRREVREEVGIEIGGIRWFGSQAWPYPSSLMIGFLADYAGGELRPRAGEIEAAAWFRRDRLPDLPHPSTIAYQMIQAVLRGEQGAAPPAGPEYTAAIDRPVPAGRATTA